MNDCLFCKIVNGDIPSRKIYEDDQLLAFHDINPAAPVHFLIIPKVHLCSLADAKADHQQLLGAIMLQVSALAKAQGLDDGFRTVINSGKGGGQEVFHLHVHVLGGGRLPPMVAR